MSKYVATMTEWYWKGPLLFSCHGVSLSHSCVKLENKIIQVTLGYVMVIISLLNIPGFTHWRFIFACIKLFLDLVDCFCMEWHCLKMWFWSLLSREESWKVEPQLGNGACHSFLCFTGQIWPDIITWPHRTSRVREMQSLWTLHVSANNNKNWNSTGR